MTTVGIIANPASGKDIRRLVAHGSVFDNDEKVNIVRRVLVGLEAVGVHGVYIMPDSYGIGQKALLGMKCTLNVSIISMPVTSTQKDSTRATEQMISEGVGCIITLGGDGTNRAVAKVSGNIPIMAISTGTNNVFPTMIEGTIAGMAAGLVAKGLADDAVRRLPRLDVTLDNAPDDIALIDAAVYNERFIAARAIWDVSKIEEVILTRPEPGSIGLSSIGAHILDGSYAPDQGLYLRLEPGGRKVLAAIAPGLIREVSLGEYRLLGPSEEVVISHDEPCVLALDGEREIHLPPGTTARVWLNGNGPRVINARAAIEIAARAGAFVGETPNTPP